MASTSRRLDLDGLWRSAAGLGIDPAVLARRAGMRLNDRDALLHLRGLSDLSAAQLVALADVLELTVEELLTTADTDTPAELRIPRLDGNSLHAALLRFGDLTEHQIMEAFGWGPDRLNAAVAHLHRHLEPGAVRVRRVSHRLRLDIAEDALSEGTAEALASLHAKAAALTGDLTPSCSSRSAPTQ